MSKFPSSYIVISIFDDTPEDKERYIADYLERGYTYPQIMKECHVSPVTISKVKKAMLGYTDVNNLQQHEQISKETQALKLFKEGKKPIDVATELDIATDFVFVIHERYQRLRNLEGFNSAFEQVKGNISPYLRLFDLMNELGMSPEQVAEQVKYGYELPQLQNIHKNLENQNQDLANSNWNLHCQSESMAKQVQQYKESLQFYGNEIAVKTNEIISLSSTINRKKRIIQRLDNREGYNRIKKAAEEQTEFLLQNNRELLSIFISIVLEAIRRYPAIRELIFDLLTLGSTTSNQQSWTEYHKSQLVQLGEHIFMEMQQQITKMAIGKIQDKNSESEVSKF